MRLMRHHAWRRPAPGDPEAGFTMIEMMAALVVFGLISLAVGSTLIQTIGTSRESRQRTVAASVAESAIDTARNLPTSAIAQGQTVTTQTVGATTFTVTQTAAYVQDGQTASTCDSGSTSGLAYVRVTESVTWPRMDGVKPVRSDTLKAININGLDPTLGSLSVKVLNDRNPLGLSGMPVTVTSSAGSQTLTTGADGCVVFTGLPTGTVTATVAQTGYVTPSGAATATATPSISGGLLQRQQFAYDLSGAIAVTPVVPAGFTPPSGLLTTLMNTNFTGGYLGAACTPGTGCSALYPSNSGYVMWAGDCAAANPGLGANGGSTPSAVVVVPGSTVSTTLNSLDGLTVTNTSGKAAAITVSTPSDTACPAGHTYTYNLAASGASASTAIALPLGSWTVKNTTSGSTFSAVTVALKVGSAVQTVNVNK